MALRIQVRPEVLPAAAGGDATATVAVTNDGAHPAEVVFELHGDAAGWAAADPPLLTVPAGATVDAQLRVRLPRAAPGGTGPVSLEVHGVGADGERVAASVVVEIEGRAELVGRASPLVVRGARRATGHVTVDNLGNTPARAMLTPRTDSQLAAAVDPDSVVVLADGSERAAVHLRPVRRFWWGPRRRLPWTVVVEPLGGAPIEVHGQFEQRGMLVAVLPAVAVAVVVLAAAVAGAAALLGDDEASEPTDLATGATTTVAPTTTAPTTTTPPAPTTEPAPAVAPPATVPPAERRLAFQSLRSGNPDVWTVAPDGSDPRNLTNHPAHDSEPAWSPDGNRLAFDSDRDGGAGAFDVYLMAADGTGVVRLTDHPAPDGYPSWSPDGTRIAFVSLRDGNSELYIMNADGTDQRRLTNDLADDGRPAWSPDGSRIAFQSNRSGNYELWAVAPDGTGLVNLTNHPAADRNPAWSPDGGRLAFDSSRDGGEAIWVLPASGAAPDGSGAARLTAGEATWPAWSPDGASVAYQAPRDGDVELAVVPATGGAGRFLTESPGADTEPAW